MFSGFGGEGMPSFASSEFCVIVIIAPSMLFFFNSRSTKNIFFFCFFAM